MKRKTFKVLVFVKRTRCHSDGKFPIYVRITLEGERTEFATNYTVQPELWDDDKACAKGKSEESEIINSGLTRIRLGLLDLKTKMELLDELSSPQQLRDRYLGINTPTTTVLKLFQQHNDNCEKLKGRDFAPATVCRYKTTKKLLAAFIKAKYNRSDYPLNEISSSFIKEFELFLKTVRGCSHNTSTKYLKNFKKIILIALNYGYIDKNPFASIKFHLKEVDIAYLTQEELDRICKKEFSIERLEKVRDVYVFCCFTGLAFSDVKQLNEENIETLNGQKWIVVKRQKTKKLCQIPLLPPAQAILNKYEHSLQRIEKGLLLPVLSNVKMNAYLKEIADLCEIKKHLCTHTGRHTFATTVTLANDMPVEVVSKILGHSSLNMTQRYARVTTDLIKKNMDKIKDRYLTVN